MKAFWTIFMSFIWLPAAMAIDREDPSGAYQFGAADFSVMIAGNRAAAFYWGDNLNEADRSCACAYTFVKTTQGRWKSTAHEAVYMSLDEKGLAIHDSELGCCGSGVGSPVARYSEGRTPETCQVTGKNVPQIQPGTTVRGVTVPDWAGFEDTPGDDLQPKHMVRAPVDGSEQLFIVPDSELRCESSKRRPTLEEAHASALALFKAGKPLEAAFALRKGTGPKPWTITQDNLVAFNDFGFFLEQAKSHREAVEVLGLVIAAFPDRAVAHLNLADAYAGLGDAGKAKAAYKRYVELMERSGKGKIPERVRKLVQE